MLDIKFVRENPDAIDVAMANRQTSWDREKFFELDDERRAVITEVEELQATRNAESKKIGALMKEGKKDEAEAAKEAVRAVNEKIDGLAERRTALEQEQYDFMAHLPNIPCEATPYGKDEDENIERRRWGTPREFDFDFKPHWDLGTDLDILDFERGNKLSGSRFTVLGGAGARLERALINFFLDTHTSRGFKEWWPPIVVKRQTMFGTGQLPDKEGQMYHATADNFYMIPTAEVPVTNIYRDVILDEKDFPVKMTAYTPCFRREAGSYGKDVRGLNRLHQFDKVEIVQLSLPEASYEALDGMVAHVESIVRSLGLPYRILRLCGGDMSFTSALTYDFEVYSEAQKRWLEVSSVSNFESFQANRLKLRYRDADKKTQLAHTLNGSSLALPRIVAALLENFQTPEGIRIPEVLVPYTGFDFIK
mgnify:CR=1 FL=1